MSPERFDKLQLALNRRQDDLAVVLVNIEDPGNVAAIIRSCDAVGVQDIYILDTITKQERVWKRRSSRSAEKWVSLHQFTDEKECFSILMKQYSKIYAAYLSTNGGNLYSVDFTCPVALVFGNEKHGLDENVLKYCDGSFIIPQVGVVPSLNVSVACAVTLYEAYRQKKQAGHYEMPKLPPHKMSLLQKEWQEKSKE